jgi:hypothetical protein
MVPDIRTTRQLVGIVYRLAGPSGGRIRRIRALLPVAAPHGRPGRPHGAGPGRDAVPVRLVESGQLTPVIDRTLLHHEAAVRRLLDGKARGHVVINLSPCSVQTTSLGSPQ